MVWNYSVKNFLMWLWLKLHLFFCAKLSRRNAEIAPRAARAERFGTVECDARHTAVAVDVAAAECRRELGTAAFLAVLAVGAVRDVKANLARRVDVVYAAEARRLAEQFFLHRGERPHENARHPRERRDKAEKAV